MKVLVLLLTLSLAACAQSPEDKEGQSSQRTLVIFCGILGACEIEHADNTHAATAMDEGAQDVAPTVEVSPLP